MGTLSTVFAACLKRKKTIASTNAGPSTDTELDAEYVILKNVNFDKILSLQAADMEKLFYQLQNNEIDSNDWDEVHFCIERC